MRSESLVIITQTERLNKKQEFQESKQLENIAELDLADALKHKSPK